MLPFARRAAIALCAFAAAAFVPATAADQANALPKGVAKASTVDGITEYRLDNGLRFLLYPDASKPVVTVNVTYLVGSRHENYGETGMAHLLEHLVFKGTPKIPKVDAEFTKRGMRVNGSTTQDRTNYYESFQASDENLKWAIDMEADRMVNSFIAKKDLDSEMTVVRNEMERGENSPFAVLFKRMQSIAFDWHNNGNSTIGNRSDVENVKIENLQAFYRQYYQPDNAVLMVAGKFDEAKVLGWVTSAFGKIPKPKRTLPQFWTVEPQQDGERSFIVRRKGDFQIVAVGYKIPADLHADSDALGYALEILNDTPNGRLHKALVTTGKAAQVTGFALSGAEPGIMLLGAIVKAGDPVEPVREALIATVEDLAKNPPTKEEIERAKRKVGNRLERLLADSEKVGLNMSEYIAVGDWRLLFRERETFDKVTAEQVTAAAGAYFRRDNRTLGMFLPEDQPQRASITAAPSAAEVLKDFKPPVRTEVAEAFDPSPDNIEKRTERRRAGGLELALLPKKNRGETVQVALNLHWGDEKSLMGKRQLAQITNAMLTRGTSKYTREQLADEMQRLKMNGSLFRFETTRPLLNDSLRLVAHVLKEASFPQAAFDEVIKQALLGLEAQRSEPSARATEVMGEHFNRYPKGDWRAFMSMDESIAAVKAVTLDDVKAFHKAFYGATKGELAIIGDFDASAATKVIENEFANWKSAAGYVRLDDKYAEIGVLTKTVNTPDKENGVYSARLAFRLKDSDPDYAALLVAEYLFGGAAGMNARLMERVRQKDGLSYGISGAMRAGVFDDAGSYNILGTAAPQNLAKVAAAVREELELSVTKGFSAEEVAKGKSGLLQRRLQARAQDNQLANSWATTMDFERSYAWAKALEAKIAALTPEQVNAAWRRVIEPSKFSVVMAYDEAKAKAATSK